MLSSPEQYHHVIVHRSPQVFLHFGNWFLWSHGFQLFPLSLKSIWNICYTIELGDSRQEFAFKTLKFWLFKIRIPCEYAVHVFDYTCSQLMTSVKLMSGAKVRLHEEVVTESYRLNRPTILGKICSWHILFMVHILCLFPIFVQPTKKKVLQPFLHTEKSRRHECLVN